MLNFTFISFTNVNIIAREVNLELATSNDSVKCLFIAVRQSLNSKSSKYIPCNFANRSIMVDKMVK